MNGEQNFTYVEVDDALYQPSKEPSRAKGIVSMALGIASIPLCGIFGIILAVIARRMAMPILSDFAETVAAKMARVGRITGTVGLILSIIDTILGVLALAGIVALIFVVFGRVGLNIGGIGF